MNPIIESLSKGEMPEGYTFGTTSTPNLGEPYVKKHYEAFSSIINNTKKAVQIGLSNSTVDVNTLSQSFIDNKSDSEGLSLGQPSIRSNKQDFGNLFAVREVLGNQPLIQSNDQLQQTTYNLTNRTTDKVEQVSSLSNDNANNKNIKDTIDGESVTDVLRRTIDLSRRGAEMFIESAERQGAISIMDRGAGIRIGSSGSIVTSSLGPVSNIAPILLNHSTIYSNRTEINNSESEVNNVTTGSNVINSRRHIGVTEKSINVSTESHEDRSSRYSNYSSQSQQFARAIGHTESQREEVHTTDKEEFVENISTHRVGNTMTLSVGATTSNGSIESPSFLSGFISNLSGASSTSPSAQNVLSLSPQGSSLVSTEQVGIVGRNQVTTSSNSVATVTPRAMSLIDNTGKSINFSQAGNVLHGLYTQIGNIGSPATTYMGGISFLGGFLGDFANVMSIVDQLLPNLELPEFLSLLHFPERLTSFGDEDLESCIPPQYKRENRRERTDEDDLNIHENDILDSLERRGSSNLSRELEREQSEENPNQVSTAFNSEYSNRISLSEQSSTLSQQQTTTSGIEGRMSRDNIISYMPGVYIGPAYRDPDEEEPDDIEDLEQSASTEDQDPLDNITNENDKGRFGLLARVSRSALLNSLNNKGLTVTEASSITDIVMQGEEGATTLNPHNSDFESILTQRGVPSSLMNIVRESFEETSILLGAIGTDVDMPIEIPVDESRSSIWERSLRDLSALESDECTEQINQGLDNITSQITNLSTLIGLGNSAVSVIEKLRQGDSGVPGLSSLVDVGCSLMSDTPNIEDAILTLADNLLPEISKYIPSDIAGLLEGDTDSIFSAIQSLPIGDNSIVNIAKTIASGIISGDGIENISSQLLYTLGDSIGLPILDNIQPLLESIQSGNVADLITNGSLSSIVDNILGEGSIGRIQGLVNNASAIMGTVEALGTIPELLSMMNENDVPILTQMTSILGCLDIVNRVGDIIGIASDPFNYQPKAPVKDIVGQLLNPNEQEDPSIEDIDYEDNPNINEGTWNSLIGNVRGVILESIGRLDLSDPNITALEMNSDGSLIVSSINDCGNSTSRRYSSNDIIAYETNDSPDPDKILGQTESGEIVPLTSILDSIRNADGIEVTRVDQALRAVFDRTGNLINFEDIRQAQTEQDGSWSSLGNVIPVAGRELREDSSGNIKTAGRVSPIELIGILQTQDAQCEIRLIDFISSLSNVKQLRMTTRDGSLILNNVEEIKINGSALSIKDSNRWYSKGLESINTIEITSQRMLWKREQR